VKLIIESMICVTLGCWIYNCIARAHRLCFVAHCFYYGSDCTVQLYLQKHQKHPPPFYSVLVYKHVNPDAQDKEMLLVSDIAAIIFIIITAMQPHGVAAVLPQSYDAKDLRPMCSAWSHVLSQGNASSCCAAAMATSLSLRECLRDGRDTMYSAQQIWDCSGAAISSVKNGTLLQRLIDAMLVSGDHFLVRHECAPTMLDTEPSSDRCERTCPDEMTRPVAMSAAFKLSGEDGGVAARRHMKEEIMRNGPVLAVLAFPTNNDLIAFSKLGAGQIFIPSSYEDDAAVSYHCIVAYGWGVSKDGQEFWRVQNSYGTRWGDYGVGRVGIGTLERNWRSVSTPRGECVASMEQLCILPPLLSEADDDDKKDLFSTVMTFIADASHNATYNIHNGNKSWATYYYNNYYRNFDATKLNNYYKETLRMHYHTITTMPTNAIVGVTLVSSIVVVCLLFMFIPPAEPVEAPAAATKPVSYYSYYAVPTQPWRTDTARYVWHA
jgi:hypothetical protein